MAGPGRPPLTPLELQEFEVFKRALVAAIPSTSSGSPPCFNCRLSKAGWVAVHSTTEQP